VCPVWSEGNCNPGDPRPWRAPAHNTGFPGEAPDEVPTKCLAEVPCEVTVTPGTTGQRVKGARPRYPAGPGAQSKIGIFVVEII